MIKPMSVFIDAENPSEAEHLAAILCLGLCAAVEGGYMSADTAEAHFFNPHSMNVLRKIRASSESVEMVRPGLALGAISRHMPGSLHDSLNDIRLLAQSILASLPSSPDWGYVWLQLPEEVMQGNPIEGPLRSLLDDLDTVNSEHAGVSDDAVGERMYEAVRQSFLVATPGYTLPREFGMSDAEGDGGVRQALSRFLGSPQVVEAQAQLQTPQERLEAFQDPYVRSEGGKNFDGYFPYRARLEEAE